MTSVHAVTTYIHMIKVTKLLPTNIYKYIIIYIMWNGQIQTSASTMWDLIPCPWGRNCFNTLDFSSGTLFPYLSVSGIPLDSLSSLVKTENSFLLFCILICCFFFLSSTSPSTIMHVYMYLWLRLSRWKAWHWQIGRESSRWEVQCI